MLVTPYDPDKHEDLMKTMLNSNGMKSSVIAELPNFGLIAIEDGRPVAAGFIRRMEGKLGMLDSYISFSYQPPDTRDKALDMITAKLCSIAKVNETTLLAFSFEQNIVDRAIKHGFVNAQAQILIKI